MNKPMFVIFDTNAYYQTRGGNTAADVKPPKKYMIPAAGVVEGGVDDYNTYAYSIYADIDTVSYTHLDVYKRQVHPP